MSLKNDIRSCRKCEERFKATASGHTPRPIVWFDASPSILVAGQAPGRQVHEKGVPFRDRSGDRLRDWMGIDADTFYDRRRISILPTAFCFPGNDPRGADLPPPAVCWNSWHKQCLDHIGPPRLRILVGSHAIRRHLQIKEPLTDTIRRWQVFAPSTFVLPHPSWRNNNWLKANPWFETDLLPVLKTCVRSALSDPQ